MIRLLRINLVWGKTKLKFDHFLELDSEAKKWVRQSRSETSAFHGLLEFCFFFAFESLAMFILFFLCHDKAQYQKQLFFPAG